MTETILDHDEQMEAYTQAVKSGLYDKKSGLTGKYDNVRRYWEDEVTRVFLRPHLQRLIERSQSLMRRVRIMDLGCGSADGYELLTGVRQVDPSLQDHEVRLLTPEVLGEYKGVDLNDDLIEQAKQIYGDNPKMVFEQGSFADGLPLAEGARPYDLYFTSYGTMSHNNDDEDAVRLLADIARRVENYCVIVCDWLGRWSYEWRDLWVNDLDERRNMDYVVSYIYEKEEREARRDELQHLTLRLMSRGEAEDIVRRASEAAGVPVRPLAWFDRSIFTGRHMDTGDYNPHAQPIRKVVNSLHEANVRTDLSDLRIDFVPKPGFDFVNDYYDHLQMAWNTLVDHVQRLLDIYDEGQRDFGEPPPQVPASYPPALRDMMDRMTLVIRGTGWLQMGLPRENIVEPQLGYALHYLVTNLQDGQGCGHGLVGIFEVDKENG